MIRPEIDTHGFSVAVCTCDVCGVETSVRAKHERHRGHLSKRGMAEGQVYTKLQGMGWTHIKKTLRCPKCEEERVAYTHKPMAEQLLPLAQLMEKEMSTTDDLRQPTREQKRQIMGLLEEVYDTKAGRYSGVETDKTVAETLGGGIMPGWVAQLREEFFGPDGGNEELEVLEEELKKWTEEAALIAKNCSDDINNALASLREYNKMREKLTEFATRIDKLKKAVGPKAEHV